MDVKETCIPLPARGSVKIEAAKRTPSSRPSAFAHILVDDPRGYRSFLSKVPPGPLGEWHAHDEIEQIYVLEGDFYDDEASYGPGDFVLRMPGAMHRAGSRNGATMLIVYAPMIPGNT